MALKPPQVLGVIDRMIKQLTETYAAFQEDKHPDISASTYAKVCADMDMQKEAMAAMRAEYARIYGEPAVTIEGAHRAN